MKALRSIRRTRELFALLWPYARGQRTLLWSGLGLSVLLVALRVAQPWPLKWVLDLLTGSHHHTGLGGLLQSPALGTAGMGALYLLISLAAASAEYWQLMVLTGLGNRMLYSFRTGLFAHVVRQPLTFHESRDTGELLTRIVYDTARLRQGVNGLLTQVFQTSATFLATSAVLLWLNAELAGVVVVSGMVALTAMARSNEEIARAARKQRQREGKLAALVTEDLLGIRELQTFRAGTASDGRFGSQNTRSLTQEQKVRRLGAGLLLRIELLIALSVTVILWVGAREVRAGQLTPGDLVLFVSYAVSLYRPFSQFARQTARSGRTFACAERLTKIMQEVPAVADRPGAVAAPPLRGEFVFQDVSVESRRKGGDGRRWALSSVSLALRAGHRVGIVGGNGAGKSTLLRLALRLADPGTGRILLDGHDLRDYTIVSLRDQISAVFQSNVFFGLTVRENIALGKSDATLEEVQAAARSARANCFIERLPLGYDTPVQHRGGVFSGGEQQRIALARALLRNGRIWLLDEPTTGLDATTADALVRLLLEATQGRTVLWVTHDAAVLPFLDYVLALDGGRIAFAGTPQAYRLWLPTRVA